MAYFFYYAFLTLVIIYGLGCVLMAIFDFNF